MNELDLNTNHGHVSPRPDGIKARCGGPRLCDVCAKEYATKYGRSITDSDPVYDAQPCGTLIAQRDGGRVEIPLSAVEGATGTPTYIVQMTSNRGLLPPVSLTACKSLQDVLDWIWSSESPYDMFTQKIEIIIK